MSDAPNSTDPATLDALRTHFGFEGLRGGQGPVIRDILSGRPTIAVMPTGAGKSLCYQLPAMMLDGLTVVISPLISLMKDQVDGLRARDIPADFINSSLTLDERRAVEARVDAGTTKLLYVAPERFGGSGGFERFLARQSLALFAVDEAHCISRWGHDFRPDYRLLGGVLERLRPAKVLACTATATPTVRDDIGDALGLTDPAVHVSGFLRDNLRLEVRYTSGDRAKEAALVEALQRDDAREGAIIVYANTRKRVDAVAPLLEGALGEPVAAYHGGMDPEARTHAQDTFMNGDARVAVATNAFGMGVDRSDVRVVAHFEMPRTIEGYYQEVGRAGRDGKPSRCLLLYNPNDSRVHEFLIEQGDNPEHRASEARKLRDMKRFVHTEQCRHAALLAYFGEEVEEFACPGCDRCARRERGAGETPDEQQTTIMRKALAGVARAGGRFGLGKVAKMLAGSQAADVAQGPLGRLSTYGLLSELGVRGCSELLHLLVEQGCCRIAGGDYPLLQITEEGADVMKSNVEPWFALPAELRGGGARLASRSSVRRERNQKAMDEAFADADPAVVQALRALRSELAAGKPAYTVFDNKTLAALAAAEPDDEASFLAIRGLGPTKWRKYGDQILDAIAGARG